MTPPRLPALQDGLRVETRRSRGGLLADTLGVSALTVAAKAAGAAKSVVIAGVFGAGPELDAFLLAFLIPSFLTDVFCGSLIPALVPAFIEAGREGDRIRARVQRWCLNAGCAATLLLFLASLGFTATNLPEHSRQTLRMTAIMSPMLALTAIANVWRAALNARKSFLLPAAGLMLPPCVLIASLLLTPGYGVAILAWATTLAVAFEAALLAYGVRAAGLPLFPETGGPSIRRVWREYGYLTAAAALGAGGYFLGQSLTAGLTPGSLSVLNYGTRLSAVLLGIGPAALGVTILPRFAELAAFQDGESLRLSLLRTLAGAAAMALPVTALLMAASSPIVQFALQHGAFTGSDTAAVAAVQRISLLQLPFAVCSILLTRVLAALAANRGLLPVSAIALIANVVLSMILIRSWGVLGIAAAISASQAILCVCLLWLVFRNHGRRFRRDAEA